MQLLQPASAAAFGFKVGQSVPRIHEQVRQSVEYFWKLWRTHYLTQHTAERLAKGNARFFNLAVGDKVLLKDNFRTSNIFAKADWTPVRVTEIFPSRDGAVRTVTVRKENGDEQRLTTDKLAIVEEDLLDRYRQQQGLQTVAGDEDKRVATPQSEEKENPTTAGREGLRASLQCDTSGDRAPSAHATPSTPNVRASAEETTSAGRGRPRGAKNRKWRGDATRYNLRSKKQDEEEEID
jgi:hypothetical protein